MLNYIDVHTHLADKKLIDNIDSVRGNYLAQGVKLVIDSGCDIETTKVCYQNALKYNEVYFTSGVHPGCADKFNLKDLSVIEDLAKADKCLGVGECGLDYHYEGYDKTKQFEVFESQIVLANKLNKPLVIHARDACKDTVDILTVNKNYLTNGFLMHCFSESIETAKIMLDLGGYFSFGGVVTYKNAKRIDVVKQIPIDRLLIETDAPYLSPEPFRGKLNEPKNVAVTYKFIAENLGLDLEDFTNKIQDNFKRLFKR